MTEKEVLAVKCPSLSISGEKRFVVINKETGEIVDDAQGYGYKSAQKAYAAYFYKHKDKLKNKEKTKQFAEVKNWLKLHKEVLEDLEYAEFHAAKTNESLTASDVLSILNFYNLKPPVTPAEILKVWRKMI